jgi:hypothetical protein
MEEGPEEAEVGGREGGRWGGREGGREPEEVKGDVDVCGGDVERARLYTH